MTKIDTSGWKPFRIGDLFEKLDTSYLGKGKKKDAVRKEPDEEFCVPLTYAKRYNNGIMYWGRRGEFKTYSKALSIIYNGAVSAGRVYAQAEETGVLAESYMIRLKSVHVSFNTYLFLQRIIEKCIYTRYSYSDLAVWPSVQNDTVWLPVDASDEPDWVYMDEYMSAVMKESEASLESLKQVDDENRVIETSGWKEFRIGELFDIVKGTRLTKANMIPGDIRFIGSSAMNNGCTAMVGNTENMHPANTITVCYNGSVGETFYQDQPFLASDDVNVLYPKFDMTKEIALFIAPLIKSVSARYNYVDKWKQEDMIADAIELPVEASGKPDWAYMDEYMRTIMDNMESDLSAMRSID